MDARDLQRLQHMQTHCRDILFYSSICGGDFARFAKRPLFLEYVRVSMYHIGELAENVQLSVLPENWDSVCAWSAMRTQDAQSLDARAVWDQMQNEIPSLLRFCEEAKKME